MISISPTFDDSLVRTLKHDGWQGVSKRWQELCAEYELTNLDAATVFSMDNPVSHEQIQGLERNIEYISAHRPQSLEKIVPVLPVTPKQLERAVQFWFLPLGTVSYGPRDGLQLFSLYPDAAPFETYLFIVHVYYHEVSSLSYTERCLRCSLTQHTAEDFKYWIKLLIRNEGIANFAVLQDLVTFANQHPKYPFHYFTYARQLTDDRALDASFRLLTDIFDSVDDTNLETFRLGVNQIMKNKNLSIINLVGSHMARAIVRSHGLDALRDVYQKPPDEFFSLFARTDDGFAHRV